MFSRFFVVAFSIAATIVPAMANPVTWVDWQTATSGPSGSAQGILQIGAVTVNVSYAGEVAFAQTNGGTNYWTEGTPKPYTGNPLVDNAPGTPDIIALSTATTKLLTFSQAIDNLFFAFVSLNGNGYAFNEDFEIVGAGCGYWGCGDVTKVVTGLTYNLNSTGGEPHGVIRFDRAVSSISWTSQSNEFWNGFTVGTYGLAAVPEPSSAPLALLGMGLLGITAARIKRRQVVTARASSREI